MKIFVKKWVSGLQEMMMQKQSEHKMRPCDDTQGWGEKGETDGLPRGARD